MSDDEPGRFKDHYSAQASSYAAYRPSYPAELVDFLADLAPRRHVAWEAGCGSGQLTVRLAERFERVIATDASAGQIAAASPHPNVEYRCAIAERSSLPAGVVDLAVAAQAAHWFDIDAYYTEVRCVTRPGSVVALVCYELMRIDEELDAVVQHFYSDVLASYWPPERRHVEVGYRTLPFPFDEVEAPHLEMRAEWTLAQLVGYVDTWSAVRALEKAQGRARLETFRRDLAGAWGSHTTARTIRWPLALRVGRV